MDGEHELFAALARDLAPTEGCFLRSGGDGSRARLRVSVAPPGVRGKGEADDRGTECDEHENGGPAHPAMLAHLPTTEPESTQMVDRRFSPRGWRLWLSFSR